MKWPFTFLKTSVPYPRTVQVGSNLWTSLFQPLVQSRSKLLSSRALGTYWVEAVLTFYATYFWCLTMLSMMCCNLHPLPLILTMWTHWWVWIHHFRAFHWLVQDRNAVSLQASLKVAQTQLSYPLLTCDLLQPLIILMTFHLAYCCTSMSYWLCRSQHSSLGVVLWGLNIRK